MEESYFRTLASDMLEHLAMGIETADKEGRLEDIELQSGVLTIYLANGKQYVINQHTPSRQIWVSSPKSGAGYFRYMEATGAWVDAHGHDLRTLLSDELQNLVGLHITWRPE